MVSVHRVGQLSAMVTEVMPGLAAGELVRSDPAGPGIRRRRCGRGFRYFTPDGSSLTDPGTLARIKALVIPPAWEDVWICPDGCGHVQAVGTDDAGRRQYRYHDLWREQRDQEKFDRVLELGRALPRIRAAAEQHVREPGLTRNRVLAAAIRLTDLGLFRTGGEEYAAENSTYGLATILREHVTCSKGEIIFEYTGKHGKQREQAIADEVTYSVIQALKRRRSGDTEDLLAYRSGSRWHNVSPADINDYLREVSGGDFTAKDFRTWHATVLAAVGLAVSRAASRSPATRQRAVARVVQEVAGYLGNTPAVARASYIDPRIIELYEQGVTIAPVLANLGKGQDVGDMATKGHAERAVLRLLTKKRCDD
jgi:DNA topoisomerase IB